MPPVVDRENGAGLRGDLLGDVARIEVERVGLDVREHWRGVLVEHGVRRGDVRGRGDDHLVARPDAQRLQRDVQGRRAVADGDGVLGAGVRRDPTGLDPVWWTPIL